MISLIRFAMAVCMDVLWNSYYPHYNTFFTFYDPLWYYEKISDFIVVCCVYDIECCMLNIVPFALFSVSFYDILYRYLLYTFFITT